MFRWIKIAGRHFCCARTCDVMRRERDQEEDDDEEEQLVRQAPEAIRLDANRPASSTAGTGVTWRERLQHYVPILKWSKGYMSWQDDFLGGLTIGVMVIPVSLSCAILAQRNPVYGLYTAVFPALIYTVFGSCGYANFFHGWMCVYVCICVRICTGHVND
jgi:hypothetical protein